MVTSCCGVMQGAQKSASATPGTLNQYVRDRDLAERYGTSRETVRRGVQPGILPTPVRICPPTTRWDLEVIFEAEAHRGGSGVAR